MLGRDGTELLYFPMLGCSHGDFEAMREMLDRDDTVLGLGDGGAHCGILCDASLPTYMLTHWSRDRDRGARFTLEQVVAMQTGRTAAALRIRRPRGGGPGTPADLNVIDLDGLRLSPPEMVHDLPAGGRQLISPGHRVRRHHLRRGAGPTRRRVHPGPARSTGPLGSSLESVLVLPPRTVGGGDGGARRGLRTGGRRIGGPSTPGCGRRRGVHLRRSPRRLHPGGPAAAAPTLSVMTNVAIAFPTATVHMAHAAWDLHVLSGGRCTLGLGTQVRPHRGSLGWTSTVPVERMRDAVEAVRSVFRTWQDGVPLGTGARSGPTPGCRRCSRRRRTPAGPPRIAVGALWSAPDRDGRPRWPTLAVMPVTRRSSSPRSPCRRWIGVGPTARARLGPLEVPPELIVCCGRDAPSRRSPMPGAGRCSVYVSTAAYRPVFERAGRGDLQPCFQQLTRRAAGTPSAT